MIHPQLRFADVPDPYADYESARVAILPVPYERTTSYGQGTARGPRAILEASYQVELYEEMLQAEPFRVGISTLAPVEVAAGEAAEAMQALETRALSPLEAGKLLVTLGGEHTVTVGAVAAARRRFGEIGVVQFDAHADLRASYEGSPLSHACVMRRLLEAGHPTLALGIRAVCGEEAELIDSRRLPTVWGWELDGLDARLDELLAALPERVYVTFDLDFFDPTLMPATGTPVPGGGSWYPALRWLRRIFEVKEVVAFDVVELAPRPDLHGCDFLAASLVYKCLGFAQLRSSHA